ncbi:DNA-protecting protein DprA [Enterobacter cloacae subsp. cloacae]|uniref:DNA-protecting protein DprA n=1 Tax=Enterobacter cloacae TaxID=550 RepID=UPI0006432D8C|nr:DNA-protecting protein DprA [Enterobacter cloacae]KLQ45267.1 DNA processing protein DprA [Enterobacter cloacae subsp. dissolvens]MBW4203003.1 DNA-protecting protein DprA [Enterobacter cloacae subsp. cloacae]MCK7342097.1 DNA-protecting protein DprA [Enterobacter cloacae]HCJ6524643.1 DNA-protecting protein DprA [Enterobacter cloacae]HCM9256782.1 DNA-protecting protein DprA [Enterobacter cloacae subsp. dissolvens]
MTSTEIWLRLINTGSLCGDQMLAAAARLHMQARIDDAVVRDAGLSTKQVQRFFVLNESELQRNLAWLEQPENHLLTADDPRYPPLLRTIPDYPGALFVKGNPEALNSVQLAVVGSRAPSWYGERWGKILCEQLSQSGFTITSGLACGIDGIAHHATLSAKGRSVAVLGNGLFSIYPRRHQALAARLIESEGAIVSEFPLSAPPWPANFPRRNRIISGLSLGVLVVEAALRSGSLVTARYALEQGREVFALPGPIGNPGCEGPHWLIKQGATPVTDAGDILENLRYGLHWLTDEPEKRHFSSDQENVALPFPSLLANVGDEVTPVDVVAERAGQPVPVTVAQLLELELAGWIAAVPGGYVRLRRASHVRRTDVFV